MGNKRWKKLYSIRKIANKAWSVFKRDGWVGVWGKVIFLKPRVTRHMWFLSVFERNDYAEWVRRYDTLTDERRVELHASVKTLPVKPLISVVMPVYKTRPEWLIQAIESVRKQIYPHWELCIADDASTDNPSSIISKYTGDRIKYIKLDKNMGYSHAKNIGIKASISEILVMLDADDMLTKNSLSSRYDKIIEGSEVEVWGREI